MYLERAHPAFLTTLVVLVFVPNELKWPKNNMSFFVLSIFGGWVGKSDSNMDISIFFLLSPSLGHILCTLNI